MALNIVYLTLGVVGAAIPKEGVQPPAIGTQAGTSWVWKDYWAAKRAEILSKRYSSCSQTSSSQVSMTFKLVNLLLLKKNSFMENCLFIIILNWQTFAKPDNPS